MGVVVVCVVFAAACFAAGFVAGAAVFAAQVLIYLGMAVVSGVRAGWRGETTATPPPWP